jgi:tetratricopeptide (TPR) repeat protein
MRNPALPSITIATGTGSSGQPAVDCLACLSRSPTTPESLAARGAIPYTAPQLHRLRVLACVASGRAVEPACSQFNVTAEMDADADLNRLARLTSASRRRGDGSYVARRGAILHTDAVLSGPARLESVNNAPPESAPPIRIHASDGQETNVGFSAVHWEIARLLLDTVTPARDPMVRLWYRATGTWMQQHTAYDTVHLDHARAMFPDDADVFFLSGWQHESYAGPAIQSVVRTAPLPSGVVFEIGSDRAELNNAETFFRRALALDPQMAEGRLRLGHVLLLRGKPKEAADELRQANALLTEPSLEYFGALFAGAAQEALGRVQEARIAYGQAAALYPNAQSPYLALSALSWRNGDRSSALANIEHVFEPPSPQAGRDDPWWDYRVTAGRNADALIDRVRQMVLEQER